MRRFRTYWLQQMQWWCSRSFEWWAAHLTACYVGGAVLIIASRFDELVDLKLNELGDLSAGVFGPVAFLWLVLGYVQQGRELKVSSESLVRQAGELAQNVQQQMKIVALQERQLESQAEASMRQEVQFRLMVEPNLQLYSPTGGFSNGAIYRDFSLGNIGADAQKVVVSLKGLGVPKILKNAQLLRRDGDVRFSCEFESCDLPVNFNVSAKYVNSVSQHGVQTFRVELFRSESGHGEVTISKYTGS
ncbi:hypothetical protein ACLBW8_06570 [Pseudomonas sp. M5A4_2d]